MNNNILLVIDVQKGFARKPNTYDKALKISELVEGKYFDISVATKFVNAQNSPYEKFMKWERLRETEEISIFNEKMEFIYNKILEKNTYTSVNDELLETLKNLNNNQLPTEVFICGIDTDCCVLTTAVNLFEVGIRPIVLTQYCASNGGESSHQAALTCMGRLIGSHHLVSNEIDSKSDIELIKNNL